MTPIELSKRQVVLLRVAAVIAFLKGVFVVLVLGSFIAFRASGGDLALSDYIRVLVLIMIPGATAIVGGIFALRRAPRPAMLFLLATLLFNIVGTVFATIFGTFGIDPSIVLSLAAFILALIVFLDSSRSALGTARGGTNPAGVAVPNEDGSIPEGWYADPEGKPADRFWDGTQWTDQSRPQTAAAITAMVAGAGKPTITATGEPISPQSRAAAALLCWFLGIIGIHRFYVGKVGTGVAQIFTLGGLGVWALVDFIIILTGSFRDKEERVLANW